MSRSLCAVTFGRPVMRMMMTSAKPSYRVTWRPTMLSSKLAVPMASRCLSSTSHLRSAGQSDAQLVDKLKEEHRFEMEAKSSSEPEWLTSFKKESKFTIEDEPGNDEIALVRTFGNESIRIVFSIAELHTNDPFANEESEEGEVGEGEEDVPSNPSGVRVSIIVTKPDVGGMTLDAIADSGFIIHNVSMYDSPELALDSSHAADWKRRSLYAGPTYDHLDPNLQQAFEEWLEERDINTDLSEVIQDLAEHKEQKEYVRWLEHLAKFVQA